MDAKISFKDFDKESLAVDLPEIPGKVFVDFLNVEDLTQREFHKLIDIYDKFPQSSIFFVNLCDFLKEQLQFLIERDKKIRII